MGILIPASAAVTVFIRCCLPHQCEFAMSLLAVDFTLTPEPFLFLAVKLGLLPHQPTPSRCEFFNGPITRSRGD